MKNILLSTLFILTVSFCYAQGADRANDISPLLNGETIPNETLVNSKNESIKLYSILEEKPTVLVFYRGGWCPYCNLQLGWLAQAEKEIIKLGFQIVAISPESYENIEPTVSSNEIHYKVFSDPMGNLIKKMGIAFKLNEGTKQYISSKGPIADVLPVPSVMIVNARGEILFEYINPNYKIRISKGLLLAALNVLK